MGVSEDVPDLDIAYKLCEYAGTGRLKLSAGKPVLPGRKQIFRVDGKANDGYDVIACAHEALEGRPLLVPMMHEGKRLPTGDVSLEGARIHAQREISQLPERIRSNAPARPPYPVKISRELTQMHRKVKSKVRLA
jgi:nicotinate phosphoribosyltransferase